MSKTINIILIVVLITESAFFYYYAVRTSKMVKNLRKKIIRRVQTMGKKNPEESLLPHVTLEHRVCIEIIDPISLANRESRLARIASDFVPDFITKEVYKQVQKEIMIVMNERNIKANVTMITL